MKFNKIDNGYKWKSRKCFCISCNEQTIHAYDSNSHKGVLTKIFICRTCEDTTITHKYKYKNKKFVIKRL